MFKFVVVCALLACASAQHHGFGHQQNQHNGLGHQQSQYHDVGHQQSHSNSEDAHAEIKSIETDVHEDGGFHYGYETTNHIKAFSEGDEHGNHRGNFEWVSPEGEHINVNYVADENGYQPQSDVLPTPPPIPEAILKSLKYIAEHPHDEVPQHGGRRF